MRFTFPALTAPTVTSAATSSGGRLEYADIAKALAIFLVVLGHTNWVFIPGRSWLYVDVIYAFHMPLFFLLSGFFIRPKESYSWAGWKRFLSKNLLALMVPYFIWGVMIMPLSCANLGKLLWGSWLAERAIDMKEPGRLTALWYLPAFFLARVYCEGVFHLASRLRRPAAGVASLAVPVLFALGLMLPHFNDIERGWGNPWGCDAAFVAAAFVLSGWLLRNLFDALARASLPLQLGALALSTAAFVFGVLSVRSLVTPGVDNTMVMCNSVYGPLLWFFVNAYAGSIALVVASILVSRMPFDRRFLGFVGMNTMGVYLLHKFVMLELKGAFHFAPETVWDGLLLAVPTFLICLALILVIRRFVPVLFGYVSAEASAADVLGVVLGETAKAGALEKKNLRRMLQAYGRNVLADGRIDFDETTMLLRFITPIAEAKGGEYRVFRDALLAARGDGVITPEESAALAELLRKLEAA